MFFLFTLSGTSFADSGGSAYSIFGLGDLRYVTGTRSAGMGYTGLALASPFYVNSYSPGSWSAIDRTRLEAGMLYEGFSSSDGNKSIYRSEADFIGGSLAVPISSDHGLVIIGGFTPFSNINYNTYTRGSQQGIDYTIQHVGEGGISRGFLGASFTPLKFISLGVSVEYLFGTLQAVRTFNPSNSTASGSVTTTSATINGAYFRIGGVVQGFGSTIEILQPLSIGFAASSQAVLSGDFESRYNYAAESETVAVPTSATIPVAIGVGIGYQAGPRYVFAADFLQQNWYNSSINGVAPPSLKNSYRIGVGVERSGSRDPEATGWDRISLRLGFSYLATYYFVNGEPINEWSVTSGFDIPFSGDSRFGVALEYAQRGTTKSNLIKDNIFRCTFSLNLSEQWFIRYEED